MKKILVSDLKPGMMTGEDIYAIDGQLIVSKKVILTTKTIEKLSSFGVYSIRIEETIQEPAEIVDETSSYSERIQANEDFKQFKKEFEESVKIFESGLNQIIEANSKSDAENLLSQTLTLVSKNEHASVSIMDMMLNMRNYDDSTYAHSMNTAIICNIFAGWLNMSPKDKVLATSCGLFHDIGKLNVPGEIIQKPAPLSKAEQESIRRHPIEGYNILEKVGLNDDIKNVALMHHERCDGSGYPYGFTSEKITKFAKLVTIADVYDAMTSQRIYRKPICPFDVIAQLEEDRYQKYDTDMILTFLRNVCNSFIGQRVRLDNGLEGEIIFINNNYLSKPTIRCGSKFINLSEHRNTSIVSII